MEWYHTVLGAFILAGLFSIAVVTALIWKCANHHEGFNNNNDK